MSRSFFLRKNKDLFTFGIKNKSLSIPLDKDEIVSSTYSNFIIRDLDNVRNLYFISDNGQLALESSIDRHVPYDLVLGYTKLMFASHLFNPEQKRAAIVGLGGGAMVHFLNHFAPLQKIDVIEIDSDIVNCAINYFDVKHSDNTNIYTQDAFKYFDTCDQKYDTIYFDAFLKPVSYYPSTVKVDSTGIPSFIKTKNFLKNIKKNLTSDGVVVFNLHKHKSLDEDINVIRSVFPNTYSFSGTNSGNNIVVATPFDFSNNKKLLLNSAKKLDNKKLANFSFSHLLSLCEQDLK